MEFVWVVPRSALFPECAPHGFEALSPEELEHRYLAPAREHGFFVERRAAEVRPEWKQPIPYVAVVRDGEVLCLTRLPRQGEARLHGKRSIGVGGHVEPEDAAGGADPFRTACLRELHEELVLPREAAERLVPLGLLNDDSVPVGAVHVGLVYGLDATGFEVSVRETDAMTGAFRPLDALRAEAEREDHGFESWSALLLRSGALEGMASRAAASPV